MFGKCLSAGFLLLVLGWASANQGYMTTQDLFFAAGFCAALAIIVWMIETPSGPDDGDTV